MKLSPLDIYNKEFKKATFGYNTDQVEAFLDEVGMAYEKLLKEASMLQDENDRLKRRLNSYEELEERMEKMLSTVQDSARDYTRQARKEAELIIKKAELRAEEIKEGTRRDIEEQYSRLQEMKESKNLFRIRFRTLLESHLQMLEEAAEQEERERDERDLYQRGRNSVEEDYLDEVEEAELEDERKYIYSDREAAASSDEESGLDE